MPKPKRSQRRRRNPRSKWGPQRSDGWIEWAVGGLLILVLLAWVLWPKPPKPVPEFLIAADASDSMTARERQQLCGVWSQMADSALPVGARVGVWLFDDRIHYLCRKRPASARDFEEAQTKWVEWKAAHDTTHVDLMLEACYEQAVNAGPKRPVFLTIFWDGDNVHRAGDWAKKLSSLGNVKGVWIVGVPVEPSEGKDLRAEITHTFASLAPGSDTSVFTRSRS